MRPFSLSRMGRIITQLQLRPKWVCFYTFLVHEPHVFHSLSLALACSPALRAPDESLPRAVLQGQFSIFEYFTALLRQLAWGGVFVIRASGFTQSLQLLT